MDDPEKPYPVRRRASRSSAYQRSSRAERSAYIPEVEDDDEEIETTQGGGFIRALIVGVIAGLLITVLNVVITYATAPIHNEAARQGNNISLNTAYIVAGLWCLNIVITFATCYLSGLFVGRSTLSRNTGFATGAIAAGLMYLLGFLVRYIPGYPGNAISSSPITGGGVMMGIIVALIFLLIQGFIGGLFGIWGAWTSIKRYYR